MPALADTLLDNTEKLIDQPLERGREADLDASERRIPFAADPTPFVQYKATFWCPESAWGPPRLIVKVGAR